MLEEKDLVYVKNLNGEDLLNAYTNRVICDNVKRPTEREFMYKRALRDEILRRLK